MTVWEEVALGDLGSVITGGTPAAREADWFGDETPFITPTDITEGDRRARPQRWLSANGRLGMRSKLLPPGSVGFVCIGATIGKLCLTEQFSVTNQQINSIVPRNDVDGRFLYYLLKNEGARIASMAGGAATPILNKSAFSKVLVRVPDSPTQEHIGFILGTIDDLVENNQRRVKILEEMARVIYQEWFIHFRYPGHENAALVGSPLDGLPEGWELGRVDTHFVLQRGFDLPAAEREPGSVPIIGASGVQGFHSTAKAQGPGLTTGRSGTVGVVTYVPDEFWPLNTSLWVKEFRLSTPRYAYFLLSSIDLMQAASGAAVPTLNRNVVHALPATCPPRSLVELWDVAAAPMFDSMDALRRQNRRLGELRDLLLPRLVAGQIDVSSLDLDALVEDPVV